MVACTERYLRRTFRNLHILQHDADPKHTAKLTKKWFKNNGISTLNWPSQCPDLNPIENLWNTLEVKVHKWNPQNIKKLEKLCQEEWGKVTVDQCGKLWSTIESDWKKQKKKSMQQNIRLMYPILLLRVILNFDKKNGFNHEFLIFLPHTAKTTLRDISYKYQAKRWT